MKKSNKKFPQKYFQSLQSITGGYRMEKETSTSSKKLLIKEFTKLSDLIKSKYGVSL